MKFSWTLKHERHCFKPKDLVLRLSVVPKRNQFLNSLRLESPLRSPKSPPLSQKQVSRRLVLYGGCFCISYRNCVQLFLNCTDHMRTGIILSYDSTCTPFKIIFKNDINKVAIINSTLHHS